MFYTNLNRCVVLATVAIAFGCISAHAAEEGGEAATAPAAPKEKKEKPTEAIEYVQKVTKLNTIQTRVTDAQADFDRLVERKQHASDPKEMESILKEMVEVTKQRNKDVEEANLVHQDLLYRYPSKAVELNRLYQMEQKKNIDEMQSAADLDDLLTRVKVVIERKFAPFVPEKEKAAMVAPKTEVTEQPKKLRLEK